MRSSNIKSLCLYHPWDFFSYIFFLFPPNMCCFYLSGFDITCAVIVLFCVFLHRNMDILFIFYHTICCWMCQWRKVSVFYRICHLAFFRFFGYFRIFPAAAWNMTLHKLLLIDFNIYLLYNIIHRHFTTEVHIRW